MRLRYEHETKTIRTIPENYCVFALGDDTDAALGDVNELGEFIADRFNIGCLAVETTLKAVIEGSETGK